jgi:hypothetical protein
MHEILDVANDVTFKIQKLHISGKIPGKIHVPLSKKMFLELGT